jgi:hypothetical protein
MRKLENKGRGEERRREEKMMLMTDVSNLYD